MQAKAPPYHRGPVDGKTHSKLRRTPRSKCLTSGNSEASLGQNPFRKTQPLVFSSVAAGPVRLGTSGARHCKRIKSAGIGFTCGTSPVGCRIKRRCKQIPDGEESIPSPIYNTNRRWDGLVPVSPAPPGILVLEFSGGPLGAVGQRSEASFLSFQRAF